MRADAIAFVLGHRRELAFWAAASVIAFALSFLLGAVWQGQRTQAGLGVAYSDAL